MKSTSKLALGLATIGGSLAAFSLVRGRRAEADTLPVPRGRAASLPASNAAPVVTPPPPIDLPFAAPPTTGGVMFSFPPSGDPNLDAYRKAHHVDETSPQVVQWQPAIIAQAALHGVPPAFAQAYQAIEAGGNVAAVGNPTATGPDGNPREIGLFQIYNPDDFKALGASPSELTAYCIHPAPGPKLHRDTDGGYKDGTQRNPQRLARPLTADEINRHIGLGIANILRHKVYADHYLSANGYTWTPDSPDYWAVVKAVHAWPPLVNTALAAVRAYLGRPASSWHEYRTTYEKIEPRARFSADAFHAGKDQSAYFRGLDNAEWTGGHVIPAAAGVV